MAGRTVAYTPDSQQPNDEEERDVHCMRTNAFIVFVGCTTHLEPSEPYTTMQANELVFHVNGNYGTERRVVGGDFNLRPPELPGAWPNGYDDPNNQVGAFETHEVEGDIDYLFTDEAHSSGPFSRTISPVGSSDHHYYNGGWQW